SCRWYPSAISSESAITSRWSAKCDGFCGCIEKPALFHRPMNQREIVKHQRTSTELVVYSRLAEQVVTLAWPTSKGTKIVPSGIKNYLRSRGLFLECFCAFGLDSDHPRSCQIVVSSVTGDVLGFCHFDHPRCQFKINFTEIFSTSLLTSAFGGLPTLQSGKVPEMDTVLVAFVLRRFPSQEVAPHFEGYFGEHIDGFPNGTHQLSGPILPPSAKHSSTRRRHSSPYLRLNKKTPASNDRYYEIDDIYPNPTPTRHVQTAPARVPRNAVAGPSRIPMESVSHPVPFPLALDTKDMERKEGKEARYLRKLIAGQGISDDAWNGLTDKCTKCKRIFTRTALKEHIKYCLGELIIF
ncbi:hypothetical protein B0H11DRAFT_2343523, partial [Mycena galericulata]